MSENLYENSKIYKIVDNAYTEQYIGSTTVGLSTRMARHRAKYRCFKRGLKYHGSCFLLFDKYGLENCKIELIEHYPCKDKDELRKREGYWIENTDCVNKYVAGRTQNEWHILHRKDKQEYDKIRYASLKPLLSEKLICQGCGSTYTVYHKKRHERSQKHINALDTPQ